MSLTGPCLSAGAFTATRSEHLASGGAHRDRQNRARAVTAGRLERPTRPRPTATGSGQLTGRITALRRRRVCRPYAGITYPPTSNSPSKTVDDHGADSRTATEVSLGSHTGRPGGHAARNGFLRVQWANSLAADDPQSRGWALGCWTLIARYELSSEVAEDRALIGTLNRP